MSNLRIIGVCFVVPQSRHKKIICTSDLNWISSRGKRQWSWESRKEKEKAKRLWGL
jgi:hypothetical protein